MARSRPSSYDARGPLWRTPAPIASDRHLSPSQRPTLSESAGLVTPQPLFVDERWALLQTGEGRGGTDAPRARRAVGSMAATNARVRSRLASHRWAAIVRSPPVPPPIHGSGYPLLRSLPSVSAFICVICGFSVSGRLCDFFVSLCLCVCDGGGAPLPRSTPVNTDADSFLLNDTD